MVSEGGKSKAHEAMFADLVVVGEWLPLLIPLCTSAAYSAPDSRVRLLRRPYTFTDEKNILSFNGHSIFNSISSFNYYV
jgi:hypothetical protein